MRMRRSIRVAVALLSSLPSAASALDADAVVGRLTGTFVADPAAGPEASSGRLHAVMAPVSVPALPGRAIYLQWRDGGPDGKVTRQRLWVFQDMPDGVRMKFFGFRDGPAWVDAHLAPERLRQLEPEQLVAYPPICDLPWVDRPEGLMASIPPGCRIVTQRTQRTMDLAADIQVTSRGFDYAESGRLEDGTIVFQLPPAGRYAFSRR